MSNLLPPKQQLSILHLYRKRFLSIMFLFVAALLAVGSVLLLPSLMFLKNSQAELQQKHDALAGQGTDAIAHSLSSSISDINSKLSDFANSAPTSPLVGDFITPVLNAKTSHVHLTEFSYTANTDGTTADVEISGDADSREALLDFSNALQTIPNYTDVNVPIASFIKSTDVTFTINATVTLTQKS